MTGSARRLLCRNDLLPGKKGRGQGCLRADIAADEMHHRDTADIDRSNVSAPIVGHVVDGGFRLVILVDPTTQTNARATS